MPTRELVSSDVRRLELGGDEAHLRGQLHALLAQVQKVLAVLGVEKYHRLAAQDSILGAAERENVHT